MNDDDLKEQVRYWKYQAERLRYVCRRAGICMSCAVEDLNPCTDCLGTGWVGGAPEGYISKVKADERLNEALAAGILLAEKLAEYLSQSPEDCLRRAALNKDAGNE